MFFVSQAVLILLHGTNFSEFRKHLGEFLMKDNLREMLVKDTTLLMKMVVTSPVYIIQIPEYFKIATFFANRVIGSIEDDDRNFLK
jgi:hypothetical protein